MGVELAASDQSINLSAFAVVFAERVSALLNDQHWYAFSVLERQLSESLNS